MTRASMDGPHDPGCPCPYCFTPHEHAGDTHDPDFCVYTRADGERCLMPITLRGRCIEAGRDAMGRSSSWRWWAPRHLAKLFDLWEPMIREQVATEIRAECDQFIRVTRAAANDLPVLAYTDAARIAEEGRNDET